MPTNIGTASDVTGAATVAVTVPVGGVPAGATIFACVGEETATVGGSVADSTGNSYARVAGQVNLIGNANGQLYYAFNVLPLSSGKTVTFTKNTAASNSVLSAFYATSTEVYNGGDPLDSAVTKSTNGTSGTPTLTSGTPATKNELFVGVLMAQGGSADTFTQDATNAAWATPPVKIRSAAAGNDPIIEGGSVKHSSATTLIYAPTITSASWAEIISGFKPPVPYQGWTSGFSDGEPALLNVKMIPQW
jgi:hypothetical protein